MRQLRIKMYIWIIATYKTINVTRNIGYIKNYFSHLWPTLNNIRQTIISMWNELTQKLYTLNKRLHMEENKEIQLRSVEQFVHAGSLALETVFCLFAFCFPFLIYLLANINILPFAIKYFPFTLKTKYKNEKGEVVRYNCSIQSYLVDVSKLCWKTHII